MTMVGSSSLGGAFLRLRSIAPKLFGLTLVLATGGCANNFTISQPFASPQMQAAFEAARAKCPVTVVETDEVKRCMTAQGWNYRHPWQQ